MRFKNDNHRISKDPIANPGSPLSLAGWPFDVVFPVVYALALSLVGFWIHWRWFPIGDIGVEADFYSELGVAARRLWAGEFSVYNYPFKGPFYSFVLVVVHLLGGDWYRNGVGLNLLCAAGILVLIYRIYLRYFGRRVAIAGTVAVSLVYEFFLHAHKASSDLLFVFLFWSAAALLLTTHLTWGRIIGCAILSGLAFLTRYNGLVLPVTVVFFILWVAPYRQSLLQRWQTLGLFLLVLMATVTPWYALNYTETGSFLATRHLQNIFVEEFYPGELAADLPSGGLTSLPRLILHDPLHFGLHALRNVGVHLWLDFKTILGLPAALLVVLGLLRLFVFPPTRRQVGFYFFPLCYFLAMCLVYHQPRFSLTLLPAYFALGFSFLGGADTSQVARWAVPWRDRILAGWSRLPRRHGIQATVAVILLVCFWLLASQVSMIIRAERYYYERRPLYILGAAARVKDHSDDSTQGAVAAESAVMAAKAHLAFYADLPFVPYPVSLTTRRDLIDDLAERGVGYLEYSDIERQYYPEATFLARFDGVRGIEKIYEKPGITIFAVDRGLDPEALIWNETIARGLSELQVAETAGQIPVVVEVTTQLADQYILEQDWPTAARLLRKGLATISQLPDSPDTAEKRVALQLDLSLCMWYLGQNEEGIDLLTEPMAHFTSMEQAEKVALVQALLGRHLADLGRGSEAVFHFRQARDMYHGLSDQKNAEAMERILQELKSSP